LKLPGFITDRLGFTRNESVAIIFLTGTLLAGLMIKHFFPPSPPVIPRFDYAQSDSAYAALVGAHPPLLPSDSSGLHQSNGSRTKAKATPHQININTANAADLTSLPGIGAAYADRIIAYRKEHGRFRNADDLANVKGIGKKKMEKIRPLVRLSDPGK
jgi:comEA protein